MQNLNSSLFLCKYWVWKKMGKGKLFKGETIQGGNYSSEDTNFKEIRYIPILFLCNLTIFFFLQWWCHGNDVGNGSHTIQLFQNRVARLVVRLPDVTYPVPLLPVSQCSWFHTSLYDFGGVDSFSGDLISTVQQQWQHPVCLWSGGIPQKVFVWQYFSQLLDEGIA